MSDMPVKLDILVCGTTSDNSSSVTAPARKITGVSPEQSTTVDSKPIFVRSPLRIQLMRPSRSALTACHVVGLGRPERFAEGATMGTPQARKNCRAIGSFGIRTPIVFNPAVAADGTLSF